MTKEKTINTDLIKQSVTRLLAGKRQANAATKTRGMVRGGGRKPFRQKGTGNARAGTSRSPLWTGGGITFGPTGNQNFKKRFNKKMLRQSVIELINSLKTAKNILTVDELKIAEPKTKLALKYLADNNIKANKILIVTEKVNPNAFYAFKNLRSVSVKVINELNALDLFNTEFLIIEKKALEKVEK